jgi:energy-coupling factor transporter ATP-binding protein EcfA2
MLRLPREMPRREKERRVEAVVAALGLQKARDTIIGGFMRRGVSGGERKRVSVGHELLTNPSTLLADEPTSGLDATTALHLMEVLRELARGGRAVATTIHQPSSRLYQQVDSLLLLSQGHAVYFGGAACAVDYLDRLGYEIPPRTSAADFLLDVASGEVGAGARAGEASRQFLVRAAELFLGGGGRALEGFSLGDEGALEAARAAAEAGAPTRLEAAVSAGAAERWRSNKATRRAGSLAAVAADSSALAGEHTWGAAYGTQVQLLFRRFLKTRRFESLSVQDVSQYMAVALLAGCFYWQAGRGILIGDAQQTIGLLFFGLLFLVRRGRCAPTAARLRACSLLFALCSLLSALSAACLWCWSLTVTFP